MPSELQAHTCQMIQVILVELALDGGHPHLQHVLVLGGQELGQGCVILPLQGHRHCFSHRNRAVTPDSFRSTWGIPKDKALWDQGC